MVIEYRRWRRDMEIPDSLPGVDAEGYIYALDIPPEQAE